MKDQGSMHRISKEDKNILHGRSSASLLRNMYDSRKRKNTRRY